MTAHTDHPREQARAAQIEENQAAIALLRVWRMEDANVSAEEKLLREAEGRALEEGLAAHPFTVRGVVLDGGAS